MSRQPTPQRRFSPAICRLGASCAGWLPLACACAVALAGLRTANADPPGSGWLGRVRQAVAPTRQPAPQPNDVQHTVRSKPNVPGQAGPKTTSPGSSAPKAVKVDPNVQPATFWQKLSGKPRRSAFEFWSQDRFNP